MLFKKHSEKFVHSFFPFGTFLATRFLFQFTICMCMLYQYSKYFSKLNNPLKSVLYMTCTRAYILNTKTLKVGTSPRSYIAAYAPKKLSQHRTWLNATRRHYNYV